MKITVRFAQVRSGQLHARVLARSLSVEIQLVITEAAELNRSPQEQAYDIALRHLDLA